LYSHDVYMHHLSSMLVAQAGALIYKHKTL